MLGSETDLNSSSNKNDSSAIESVKFDPPVVYVGNSNKEYDFPMTQQEFDTARV